MINDLLEQQSRIRQWLKKDYIYNSILEVLIEQEYHEDTDWIATIRTLESKMGLNY